MQWTTTGLLLAVLMTLWWIAWRMHRVPAHLMSEATKAWKEAFVREIREARLENRKLHKATLPTDERPE